MAKLLDAETLASLRSLQEDSEPGFLKGLCETYIQDAERRFGAIQSALGAGNGEGVGREAHALKSSSANLGALGMSALCRELEQMSKDGKSVDEMKPLFARIQSEWPPLQAELKQECGV